MSLKRYQAEVREKIAARLDELEQEVKNNDGHVSLETVQRVRQQIYGIIQ